MRSEAVVLDVQGSPAPWRRAAFSAAVLALSWALSPAAMAATYFATAGPCDNIVYELESGGEKFIDVLARDTDVTLWGPGLSGTYTAFTTDERIAVSFSNKRSASDNSARGCHNVGSVDLRIRRNGIVAAPVKADLFLYTINLGPVQVFDIKMHPMRPDIGWGDTTALRRCLERQNGSLAVNADDPNQLDITIPRNPVLSDCLGDLAIDSGLVPNPFTDAGPASLLWRVDLTGPANPVPLFRETSTVACLRGDCRPGVPLRVAPKWDRLLALEHPSTETIVAKMFFGERHTVSNPGPGTPLARLALTVSTSTRDSGLPVAVCRANPTAGLIRIGSALAVTFDGTASSDPNGTIVNYHWDFGDFGSGDVVEGPDVTRPVHEYRLEGRFFPTLTVTDDQGNTSSAQCEIVVDVF